MNQFRIEVATDGQAHNFNIRPLENNKYDIYTDEDKIGSIELDEDNHEHCLVSDCELDLPLINAIREGIQAYQKSH